MPYSADMIFPCGSVLKRVAFAPKKPKTRGHQARVGAETPMPIEPFKVNFRGQVTDLTRRLEQPSAEGVFPGENRKGRLIPDSRAV